jgi:hypothetical protein
MSYGATRQQLVYRGNAGSTHTYCPGFLDAAGHWNNGFYCSRLRGVIKSFCCSDEFNRFCCDSQPTSTAAAAMTSQHVVLPLPNPTRSSHSATALMRADGISGGVLGVCAAGSTLLLLSLLAALYLYRQHTAAKWTGAAQSRPPARGHDSEAAGHIWTTTRGKHSHVTSSLRDVTVSSLQPHVVIATVNKLRELLCDWLDGLLATVTSQCGAVTSQLETV